MFNKKLILLIFGIIILSGLVTSADFGYNYLENPNSFFGDVEFDGGWEDGGCTITEGDIYCQTGYFYNLTSLNITHANLTILEDAYFNGNVGIGTTNPTSATGFSPILNIAGGAPGLLLTDTTADNDAWLISTNNKKLVFTNDDDDTQPFQIEDNTPTNTLYLDDSGNVGIGTTSPGKELDVAGYGRFSGGATLSGYQDGSIQVYNNLGMGSSNNLNPSINRWSLRVRPANKEGAFDIYDVRYALSRLLIDNAGNVGIGTTSPFAQLDVVTGSDVGSASSHGIRIQTGTGANPQGLNLGANDGGYSWIQAQKYGIGKNSLSLNPNGGNVGIGTTSPGGLLHLYKGSSGASVSANSDLLVLEDDTSNGINFLVPNTLNTNINFGDPQNNEIGFIQYQHGTDTMAFRVSGTTIMNLKDGNVGIGTTTPQNKLNVIGDFNQTTGNSTFNGFYGGMYMHNDTGLDAVFNSTYQKLYFDNADNTNGFSFSNSILMLDGASGMYQAIWKAEGVGTNNHEYHGYVFVNEDQNNNTIGHTLGTGNSEIKMMGIGFVYINKYDNITIRIADLTSSASGTQIDANLNLVRIGNII